MAPWQSADRPGAAVLVGQIGWTREDVRTADDYNTDTSEWVDTVDTLAQTARAPFAVDGQTQIVAVVRHPSFAPETVAHVLTLLFNSGERTREHPTTEWEAEALLDEQDFREWLDSIDVLEKLRFVAKLPNPDVLEEFEPIFRRMEQLKAKKITEDIEPQDPEVGLTNVLDDPTSLGYLAMAARAYGYITAKGARAGAEKNYDQRSRWRGRTSGRYLDHGPSSSVSSSTSFSAAGRTPREAQERGGILGHPWPNAIQPARKPRVPGSPDVRSRWITRPSLAHRCLWGAFIRTRH